MIAWSGLGSHAGIVCEHYRSTVLCLILIIPRYLHMYLPSLQLMIDQIVSPRSCHLDQVFAMLPQ
jgi:hypothetical protein